MVCMMWAKWSIQFHWPVVPTGPSPEYHLQVSPWTSSPAFAALSPGPLSSKPVPPYESCSWGIRHHVRPPVASCPVSKIDLLAGSEEHDLHFTS